jgi:CheY-like chemotaxis protein
VSVSFVKILLAEDVDDAREMVRVILEQLGYEVLEAANGDEAVRTAVVSKPDCVLMDLSMPGIDGLLATAALRAIMSLSSVPIVAVTAYADDFSRERAFDAGCDAFLQKPFTREELAAVLDKHVRSKLGDCA